MSLITSNTTSVNSKEIESKMKPFDIYPTLVPIAFTNPQIWEDPPPILFKLLEKDKGNNLLFFFFVMVPATCLLFIFNITCTKRCLKDVKDSKEARQEESSTSPFTSSCSVFELPLPTFPHYVPTQTKRVSHSQIMKVIRHLAPNKTWSVSSKENQQLLT